MSAGTSTVKRLRGVRNEDSLLFSVKDLAASPPASPAANDGQEGSGLLDLERLTQSYFEARNENAVLGPGAELPEAAVVAAWHPARPAQPGIIGIAFAAITGVASAALILMAAWMWIVPNIHGAGPPARQAAAPASISPPEPPRPPQAAAVVTPAALPDASAEAAEPASAVPAAAPAPAPVTRQDVAAAPAAQGTQRPARAPAASRPRPRAERAESAASSPAGAAECLDEVACLLASNPPACCTRAPSSETGKPKASAPRDEDTALPDKLDRAAIQAGIGQVRERVAACERHGTGTVSLSVRVDGDGRVSAVDVKSAPSQALGSCVAQAVEDARFARSRSGQRFVYPFVF